MKNDTDRDDDVSGRVTPEFPLKKETLKGE